VISLEESINYTKKFHETYERLAPLFGYETRKDTKAFDPESPNGKLMIAVVSEIGSEIYKKGYNTGYDDALGTRDS
jgi:hypothetical protein